MLLRIIQVVQDTPLKGRKRQLKGYGVLKTEPDLLSMGQEGPD